MADDFFKVRNGFIVGEDKFTVNGTTGDVDVTGDLTVAGDNTFTGDLAVNGGDITTTNTTATIFNANATTVNIGAAATAMSIGAGTGTTTVNNDLVADSLTVSGDLAVNGGDITTTQTTATVFNTTATTLNIGGAATAMSIGNSSGTVTIPGNLTVNGTTTTINTQDLLVEDKNITMGNVAVPTDITASGGGITLLGDTNKTITWNNATDGWEFNQPIKVTGDAVLTGDLTVSGNDIKSSSATAITLSGADVTVAGDLTVTGNDIKSSSATALTLSGADVSVAGDLTVTGNDIKSSTATALTLSGADVSVAGDLTVSGNDIKMNGGTTALTLSGTGDVTVAGDLTVTGNDIKSSSATAITLNGTNVAVAGDLTVSGNDISGSGGTALTFNTVTGFNPNTTLTGNAVRGVVRDSTTLANGDAWSMLSGAANILRGLSIDNTDNTAKRPGVVLRGYSNNRPFIIGEQNRGTVASPLATANGNNLLEIAASGYNGTQWVTDAITVAPISISLQAAEAFTSPAGVNTANGSRLRVDAQPTGVTATAITRSAIINHTPNAATYRSDAWTFATREVAAGGTNTTLMNLAIVGSGGTAENTLNITKVDATTANNQGVINFATYRSSGGTYTPTLSGDKLGQYKFNGNTVTGGSPVVGPNPALSIGAVATENWSSTATGTKIVIGTVKNGSTANLNIIDHAPTAATYRADTFTLQDSSSVNLVGNNISYNRVYGQWQYDATITPAAANTAYAYPIAGASSVTDYANIASIGSTSRIIPGAAGMYKLQFSVQVDNADNGNDHSAYFWWRKNGTDVPASMGRVDVFKGGASIAGWDNMIQSANTTDYWELMYAVDDTQLTLPYYAATAFGPATASMFITLVPIGA